LRVQNVPRKRKRKKSRRREILNKEDERVMNEKGANGMEKKTDEDETGFGK
jgi:hypothetical protein